MTSIILIDKTGTVKSVNVKDLSPESLSKKAGFKTAEGFVLQHTWGQEEGLDQHISLYAKTSGRAGQENKYDFPPPVDERLFFGTCVLVGKNADGTAASLSEEDWEEIYEFLFGGFEDIGSEDSDDDEEDMDTDDELEALGKATGKVVKQTKQGYAKDGFIVDDDEEDEDYETDESSEESEDTPPPKKGRKPAAKKQPSTTVAKKEPAKKKTAQIEQPSSAAELVLEDCESELSEESYD